MRRLCSYAFLIVTLFAAAACQQVRAPSTFTLSEVFGQTSYRTDTQETWSPARIGLRLESGAQARTAVGSSILMRAEDGLARLAPGTSLTVITDESGTRHLVLASGRVFVECTDPDVTYEVEMPWGQVTARAARFSVAVSTDRGADLSVRSGTVTLTTTKDEVTLGQDQQMRVEFGQKPGQPTALGTEEQVNWERWARGPGLGLAILTPTVYAAATSTHTPTPTRTSTPTLTPTSTTTPTSTPVPTATETPTLTPVPTQTPTLTPVPTATSTRRPQSPTAVPTRTPTPIPGPLDFDYHMEDFHYTVDKGRWGATLVIEVKGGQSPFKYTVDEVVELPGPRWPFEWNTGSAMARSIQVIDARGQKVSKPWYEPSHVAP